MDECSLSYIPSRLRRKERPIIDYFEIGENLYFRCKPDVLDNPYKGISITELSHNRSGLSFNILCNPEDVLFSIKKDEDFEKYTLEVCTLEIVDLNNENKYKKTFTQLKNGTEFNAVMELLHEPENCMYPHCVFRIWMNNQVVTYENYKTTLDKLNEIRARIKEELASMIRRRQVSQKDNAVENN